MEYCACLFNTNKEGRKQQYLMGCFMFYYSNYCFSKMRKWSFLKLTTQII